MTTAHRAWGAVDHRRCRPRAIMSRYQMTSAGTSARRRYSCRMARTSRDPGPVPSRPCSRSRISPRRTAHLRYRSLRSTSLASFARRNAGVMAAAPQQTSRRAIEEGPRHAGRDIPRRPRVAFALILNDPIGIRRRHAPDRKSVVHPDLRPVTSARTIQTPARRTEADPDFSYPVPGAIANRRSRAAQRMLRAGRVRFGRYSMIFSTSSSVTLSFRRS